MTKESDVKSGLLGKVAKFIKNPTVDWADLDRGNVPAALETPQSRLALKELIRHKRHNDAVRKHEFAMLRKIRRKGKNYSASTNALELISRYSSSQLAHDAEKSECQSNGQQKREQTLRQINEIESQLSSSWFSKSSVTRPAWPRTRTAPMTTPSVAMLDKGPSSLPASDFAPATLPLGTGVLGQPWPPNGPPGAPASAVPPPLPQGEFKRATVPDQPEPPMLTQTYLPAAARGQVNAPPAAGPGQSPPPQSTGPMPDRLNLQAQTGAWDWQQFSEPAPDPVSGAPEPRQPRLPAPVNRPRRAQVYESGLGDNLEVVALRQDPEIEEAAISFANGDPVAAELALLKLVSTGGSRRKDVEAWLALFDLYRVTSKVDAFDGMVPEFTALFGRSAPQWERPQDRPVSDKKIAVPRAAAPSGAFAWTSPAQLNTRALAALTSATKRSAPPWRIDWRPLKTVEPDVLPQFNGLLTQWADTPVQLQFLGGEQLLAVLVGHSPTEDKNANPAWWRVRLSLLRLTGLPDLFDQTALDYCITYEISPPAWAPSKASYTPLASDGQTQSLLPGDVPDAPPPSFAPTTITGELLVATGMFEASLQGDILGGAGQALAALPRSLDRIGAFDFDCRALRRVDFGAAGELLNWSIEQQGQGRTVVFRDVHRLLAAFFSVIGFGAAARVALRKD